MTFNQLIINSVKTSEVELLNRFSLQCKLNISSIIYVKSTDVFSNNAPYFVNDELKVHSKMFYFFFRKQYKTWSNSVFENYLMIFVYQSKEMLVFVTYQSNTICIKRTKLRLQNDRRLIRCIGNGYFTNAREFVLSTIFKISVHFISSVGINLTAMDITS